MKLIPTQRFITVTRLDLAPDTELILPQGTSKFPHFRVNEVGPDCLFVQKNDLILCFPQNVIGFEGHDEFIIPETAIFATLSPDNIRSIEVMA